VLRKDLEENLPSFGRSSGSAGSNKCGNVVGTRLGSRADIDGVRKVGSDCRVRSGVGRRVQDNDFDSQILIEVCLEGGVVIHVVVGLDDDGGSRRQARVAGLELQDAVVELVGVRRVQVAKDVDHNGSRFGLRLTSQSHEQ